jgi:hypothetical protein
MRIFSLYSVAWISSSHKSGAYFCHMHSAIVSAGFCDISWQGILNEKKNIHSTTIALYLQIKLISRNDTQQFMGVFSTVRPYKHPLFLLNRNHTPYKTKVNTVELLQSDPWVFRRPVTPDKHVWSQSIYVN